MREPAQDGAAPQRAGPGSKGSGPFRRAFSHVEELVGGAAFVAMTVIVVVNVAFRYLFNDPLPGADELATLCFTWAVFVGAAAGVRQRLHIGIEFIANWFPPRGRAAIGLTVVLLMAAFATLIGVYGAKLMMTGYLKRTPVLQWPYTWIYLAIPVGAALMLLRLGPIAGEQLAALRGEAPPALGAETVKP
jgi:TRAP-type C4-dicarboxylate transport system permease small subunit